MVQRRRLAGDRYRLVAESRWQRPLLRLALVAVLLAAVALGYWLGLRTAAIDRDYLHALERIKDSQESAIAELNRELVDARLGQSVGEQAAQALRGAVSELRSEVAGLQEEVTFYKSLMAPSSLTKGLQIADLQLFGAEDGTDFAYQLLLTQAQVRRDWVQGSVALSVRGVAPEAGPETERLLSFADLDADGTYPLKFRFRYFQQLTGQVRLPTGFRPLEVLVTATPSGRGGEVLERTFPWQRPAG
jgi:hypothetical protein